MAVFFALRQRTEAAIVARDERIATESLLRSAMADRVEGKENAADQVLQLEKELEGLKAKEELLMNIPQTSFRLRLPPPARGKNKFGESSPPLFSHCQCRVPPAPPSCVRLLLPMLPSRLFDLADAEDVARERVMRSKQAAPKEEEEGEEERLAPWQEISLVVIVTAILAPFLFLATVDPLARPSPALQSELQQDPNAPRPPPARR
mmetsp:Transcript_305/g.531  ORF Transcript_305/g.531 Transcript_305/m.531 type:complete len:206 (-) Transcript_305:55-672(-)